ncbi:hypothetical protein LCGC14_0954210 [marine sediment metagenome]|uniref:Uncharacterized protein n=1 Tax=marine sediment metagenome TaxID=412755 RepID=A0A0F9P2G6_9ZZZZ
MLGEVRIEQVCKVLEVEEKKMHDQIVHLNGQIVYNRRIQELLTQLLRELTAEEGKSKTTKSRVTKKPKK